LKIGEFIHDFEIDAEENPDKVKLKDALGLCYVLIGLEKRQKQTTRQLEKSSCLGRSLRILDRT
jgi:hypothetical protein